MPYKLNLWEEKGLPLEVCGFHSSNWCIKVVGNVECPGEPQDAVLASWSFQSLIILQMEFALCWPLQSCHQIYP